jgi:hypothetical protein
VEAPSPPLSRDLEKRIGRLGALGGGLQEIDVHEFGDSAAIHAFVQFDGGERGLLTVFEFVRAEHDGPVTRRYAYHCTRGADFLFRYDYDPIGRPDMPEHKHVPGSGEPLRWRRVTVQDVADELRALVGASR